MSCCGDCGVALPHYTHACKSLSDSRVTVENLRKPRKAAIRCSNSTVYIAGTNAAKPRENSAAPPAIRAPAFAPEVSQRLSRPRFETLPVPQISRAFTISRVDTRTDGPDTVNS